MSFLCCAFGTNWFRHKNHLGRVRKRSCLDLKKTCLYPWSPLKYPLVSCLQMFKLHDPSSEISGFVAGWNWVKVYQGLSYIECNTYKCWNTVWNKQALPTFWLDDWVGFMMIQLFVLSMESGGPAEIASGCPRLKKKDVSPNSWVKVVLEVDIIF